MADCQALLTFLLVSKTASEGTEFDIALPFPYFSTGKLAAHSGPGKGRPSYSLSQRHRFSESDEARAFEMAGSEVDSFLGLFGILLVQRL